MDFKGRKAAGALSAAGFAVGFATLAAVLFDDHLFGAGRCNGPST